MQPIERGLYYYFRICFNWYFYYQNDRYLSSFNKNK